MPAFLPSVTVVPSSQGYRRPATPKTRGVLPLRRHPTTFLFFLPCVEAPGRAHLARRRRHKRRPSKAPLILASREPVAVDTLAAAPELLCRDFDLRA